MVPTTLAHYRILRRHRRQAGWARSISPTTRSSDVKSR